MICLGIESTAHTFGVGIITSKGKILANVKDSYANPKGGIHPTEAKHHHEKIADKVINNALETAKLTINDINLVSFSQGETARNQLISQNQCSQNTIPTSPSQYNCVAYQNCNENAPLIWCPHSDSTAYNGTYYPHTWPDNAGSEIWKFFESLE